MTKRFSKSVVFLATIGGLTAVLLGITAPSAKAQVSVTSFYNMIDASTFVYDFQVQNNSGVDVSVINVAIPATPGMTYITNAHAPHGYIINVDEGSGSLVFAEDTSTFTDGSLVDGFTLTSSMLLPPSTVDGLTSNGDPFTGSISSVQTPEAGTLPLLGSVVGIAAIATYIRRRRPTAAIN